MRLTGWLLVVMGVVLGGIGITMDPASRSALMVGAGVLIGAGMLIALVASLMRGRNDSGNDLQRQLDEFEKMSSRVSSDGAAGAPDRSDPMAILKTVMDAQAETGGDPDQLAKVLRERLGGGTTVVEGGTQFSFSGGGSADLVEKLTELRDRGVITDEQLEQSRKQLPGD